MTENIKSTIQIVGVITFIVFLAIIHAFFVATWSRPETIIYKDLLESELRCESNKTDSSLIITCNTNN